MNNYKISIKSYGENPQEAFAHLLPNMELIPTKDKRTANVCIELMGGQRTSVSYYRLQVKGINDKSVNKTAGKGAATNPKAPKKVSAKRAENEEIIRDLLLKSRHALEAFTGLDYFSAGAALTWDEANVKIDDMSDAEVAYIAHKAKNADRYDSYYDVFSLTDCDED
jgi:hypothetical protein